MKADNHNILAIFYFFKACRISGNDMSWHRLAIWLARAGINIYDYIWNVLLKNLNMLGNLGQLVSIDIPDYNMNYL